MDGNGRLGRLLIPMILVQAGVLKQPLLYLSVFFKRYRQIYYEKLQQVRVTGDWEGWLLFFADAVAATATQAVETAQQLNQLKAKDKQRISILGRQKGSARLILDALFELPIVTVNKLAEKTRLSQATINKTLLALDVELDIVKEVTGQKRNRVYIYSEYIELLNRDD
jgi:Fic family protein